MNDPTRFGLDDNQASHAATWSAWPCCPRCGAPRETACPACGVYGSDFELAEADPAAHLPASASDSAGRGSGCCHDACGCSERDDADDGDDRREDAGPLAEGGTGGSTVMLLCPICDEPFTPRFARRCRPCRHDFGSGPEVHFADVSAPNYRVLLTMLSILAMMAGAGVYLYLLFAE